MNDYTTRYHALFFMSSNTDGVASRVYRRTCRELDQELIIRLDSRTLRACRQRIGPSRLYY